jgi:hypothetical protein
MRPYRVMDRVGPSQKSSSNISFRCFKEIWKVGKVGKVGEVGKVGKEDKEDRLRELQLPTLYQILQQSNKKGEKRNEQFCCESLENVDFIESLKFGLLETATNLCIHTICCMCVVLIAMFTSS